MLHHSVSLTFSLRWPSIDDIVHYYTNEIWWKYLYKDVLRDYFYLLQAKQGFRPRHQRGAAPQARERIPVLKRRRRRHHRRRRHPQSEKRQKFC